MAKRARSARLGAWFVAVSLVAVAVQPWVRTELARRDNEARLARVARRLRDRDPSPALAPEVSLRVRRLSPLLASWETVGGCGAGGSTSTGAVKWIGHSTTGGLFQNITLLSYTGLENADNIALTTQFSGDLSDQWNVGVLFPFLYKQYNSYMGLPIDISNAGLGDINLLGTFKFGPINATSLTASLGLPTGTHDAAYKMDLLTQEKQLGIGKVTGSLALDHTLDQTWGVIVLGGLASWRGGKNDLGSYRAPMASLYGYAGYFAGPLVPAFGLTLSGFPVPDRDRGIDQDVPLLLLSPSLSLEWSTDWIALLGAFSLPFGLYAKESSTPQSLRIGPNPTGIQPWTATIGVSVSPF